MSEDLPICRTSDVLATINRDDQVEAPSVDRLKRSGPDPPLEIELNPVIRRVEYLQTHAGPKPPKQCAVLRRTEIFLRRQRRGLALDAVGDRK